MAIAVLASATPAFAGTTTFSDSNMMLSDYTVTTNLPTAAFTAQVYQGGDPDGGTSFATYYAATGPTSPAPKFWALSNSFVYDPSAQGAILAIDAAMDQVVAISYNNSSVALDGTPLQIRILAEQNGELYRSRSVTATQAVQGVWVSTSVTGLASADFLRLDPENPFAPPTLTGLDFAGGAIRFGFEISHFGVLVNGGASTGSTISYHWIDDLQLTLNTQDPTSAAPEPSTWAMMLLGFGLAGGAMRRRRAIAT